MKKAVLLPLVLFFVCFTAYPLFAASQQPGQPVQDTPTPRVTRSTAISVIAEGNDSLGARLSTRLKERFNQSSLFTLHNVDEKDTPELRFLLTTQPEFPARPGVGSIYGVCWVFSQGKGYLGYLLGREIGTFTVDEIDGLVDKLVERTDGIVAKYGNLLKSDK